MKHTDYQMKVNEVKHLEYQELSRALEAHGGTYEWNIEVGSSYPTIAINADNINPKPQDIKIMKASIVNGHLELIGLDMCDDAPVECTANDVFAGHLSYITDNIPATAEISDVSLSVPVKAYKPKVGDKVWLFKINRQDKTSDRYGQVTKIGKKFFYVKFGNHCEIRFDIATLRHDNGGQGSNYELHISQEACEYSHKAIRSRHAIGSRLFRLLTDKEAIELYDMLVKRNDVEL